MSVWDKIKDALTTDDAEAAEEARREAEAAQAEADKAKVESQARADEARRKADEAADKAGLPTATDEEKAQADQARKDAEAEAQKAQEEAAEADRKADEKAQRAVEKANARKEKRQEERQEAREERQEERQEAKQEARQDAREAAREEIYTVKSGDTLSEIGARHGADWRELARVEQHRQPGPDLPRPEDPHSEVVVRTPQTRGRSVRASARGGPGTSSAAAEEPVEEAPRLALRLGVTGAPVLTAYAGHHLARRAGRSRSRWSCRRSCIGLLDTWWCSVLFVGVVGGFGRLSRGRT